MSEQRHKRNYTEVELKSAENVTPPKKRSLSASAKPPTQRDIEAMLKRLQERTYAQRLAEMKNSSNWQSKNFQAAVYKDFKYCAHEGAEIAEAYLNLKENFAHAEEEITKLNEKIQDQQQRVYEAEEEAESTEQNLTSAKEELNAVLLMNEKGQIQTNSLKKEIAELKESLKMETEARKAAEKAVSDAKIENAETFSKWIQEYEAKNNISGMNESISDLKKELEQLQNLTTNDVVQGIQNLSKNLSSFFPTEKKEGPMWLVKKEIVESIRKNSQDEFESFLNSYLTELFKWGELILPENFLNKNKLNETHAVVAYYFKVIGEEQKQLYGKLIKKALEKLRANGRQKIHTTARKHGIIGFEPAGECFFYSRVSSGKLDPFKDGDLLHPMKVALYADNVYGIPAEFEESDFLMIIENNVYNGISYHHVDPKSGYRKIVYNMGRNMKKCV